MLKLRGGKMNLRGGISPPLKFILPPLSFSIFSNTLKKNPAILISRPNKQSLQIGVVTK